MAKLSFDEQVALNRAFRVEKGNPQFSKMTGEEAMAFVKADWPDAYVHIHGPESTVLTMKEDRRADLYAQGLIGTAKYPYRLGMTRYIDSRWAPDKIKEAEDLLWKLAAATW